LVADPEITKRLVATGQIVRTGLKAGKWCGNCSLWIAVRTVDKPRR